LRVLNCFHGNNSASKHEFRKYPLGPFAVGHFWKLLMIDRTRASGAARVGGNAAR
jgi:hypothetical protein